MRLGTLPVPRTVVPSLSSLLGLNAPGPARLKLPLSATTVVAFVLRGRLVACTPVRAMILLVNRTDLLSLVLVLARGTGPETSLATL